MAIQVYSDDFESIVFADAVSFCTEADFNNLEVVDADGQIIGAYAGGKWAMALVVSDETD